MNIKINPYFLKPEGRDAIQQQIHDARANGMTWDEISNRSPISRATMQRWSNQDMSPAAQRQRQMHQRREQLLSQKEKEQVIQTAQVRKEHHEAVSIDWTKQKINEITNGILSLL